MDKLRELDATRPDIGSRQETGKECGGVQVESELDPLIIVDPASPATPPIYWESIDGSWHGPVQPEFLGRTGSGASERFWVIVTSRGATRWIVDDLVRSRLAFEAQRSMKQ